MKKLLFTSVMTSENMMQYDWNSSGLFKEQVTLTCVGTLTKPNVLREFGCNHLSISDVDQIYELDSDGIQHSSNDELWFAAVHAGSAKLLIFADEALTLVVSVYVLPSC
jgi:hypothetical protein